MPHELLESRRRMAAVLGGEGGGHVQGQSPESPELTFLGRDSMTCLGHNAKEIPCKHVPMTFHMLLELPPSTPANAQPQTRPPRKERKRGVPSTLSGLNQLL